MARVGFPEPASNVVEFVGSLLCTERFSPETPVSPLLKNQNLTRLLISVTVPPISAPALERQDTYIKFLSFPFLTIFCLNLVKHSCNMHFPSRVYEC